MATTHTLAPNCLKCHRSFRDQSRASDIYGHPMDFCRDCEPPFAPVLAVILLIMIAIMTSPFWFPNLKLLLS